MKQFTLLAIIAITFLAATSCTEIQKGKRRAHKARTAGLNAGHVALAEYFHTRVRRLVRSKSCRAAGALVLAVSRRTTVKAARRAVRAIARCAASLKRRAQARRLRRAQRRAARAKGKVAKRVARRLRKVHKRVARRTRRARRGKKNARRARRAVGHVLVAFIKRIVATFLKL